MTPRWRSAGLATAFGIGAAGILFAMHSRYPITGWLIWRYFGYTVASAVWASSCMALGLKLVDAFRFDDIGRQERWILGFALGVLGFGMAMFALGFLQLWSPWAFVLLPGVFILSGRVELTAALQALRAWLRSDATENRGQTLLVLLAGVIGLAFVYIPLLNPDNIGYDTRWYHFATSEQYAIRGGIERFSEGLVNGAQPQLPVVIYGWAFLLPGGKTFDFVELGLHLELTLFVATLASIPSLARSLTGERQPYAWVFVLLFPGLYLYDSNLIGGADHIAAFWAVPLALAAYRAWRDFSPRSVVLVVLLASATLLTKYTAASLLVGPGLLLLGRAAFLVVRSKRSNGQASAKAVIASVVAGLAIGLVVTAPHWLKNLLFYGDPLFPLLTGALGGETWVSNADLRLENALPSSWQAARSSRGVLNTLAAPFVFAFQPHDWTRFHGKVPVFGFLYTATMPAIFFVAKRGRIAVMYVAISLGIMFWYWTFHQDRYLQAMVPWMAACVSAIVSQAWRLGRPVRLAIAALVAAQVIVGAGVPFLPTHSMIHKSPFASSITLFGKWLSDPRVDLEWPKGAVSGIRQELPEDAKILLHDTRLTLGVGRPVVSDAIAWQLGIEYGEHAAPSEMWHLLRSHGVTHVAWQRRGGIGRTSIATEAAFHYFVNNHLTDVRKIHGYQVGALTEEPPSDDGFTSRVAVLDCAHQYDPGIYDVRQLTLTRFPAEQKQKSAAAPIAPLALPLQRSELADVLTGVDAIWNEAKCVRLPTRPASIDFVKAHDRKGVTLYVRRVKPRGAAQ